MTVPPIQVFYWLFSRLAPHLQIQTVLPGCCFIESLLTLVSELVGQISWINFVIQIDLYAYMQHICTQMSLTHWKPLMQVSKWGHCVRHISVTTKASPFDGEQNAVVRFTVDSLSKLLPYTSVYHSNETSSQTRLFGHSFLLNAYLCMSWLSSALLRFPISHHFSPATHPYSPPSGTLPPLLVSEQSAPCSQIMSVALYKCYKCVWQYS